MIKNIKIDARMSFRYGQESADKLFKILIERCNLLETPIYVPPTHPNQTYTFQNVNS